MSADDDALSQPNKQNETYRIINRGAAPTRHAALAVPHPWLGAGVCKVLGLPCVWSWTQAALLSTGAGAPVMSEGVWV